MDIRIKMVIRVEDLVESILKQHEEFLSIENTNPDVISVKSIDIYHDLVFILEKVPHTLINRIGIDGSYIHISTADISTDDLDIDVRYNSTTRTFHASVSLTGADYGYTAVESIDEFVNSLIGKESGKVLNLHPYGIIFSKDTLSRYSVFLSYLYPIPIDFEDDVEEQYLYMFKDRDQFFNLLEFNIECFRGCCMPQWEIPYPPQRDENPSNTRCSAVGKKTDAPCKNKAKFVVNGQNLCGLHTKTDDITHESSGGKSVVNSTFSLNHRDIDSLFLAITDEE